MSYSVKNNIDIAVLERWLNNRLSKNNHLKIIDSDVPKSGFSALTIVIEVKDEAQQTLPTKKYAVRLQKTGRHVFLGADISLQGQMMSALQVHGLPVPEIIGVESDAALLGGKFLVMEYFNAETLPQAPNYLQAGLLTKLEPDARFGLISDALTQIARINKLSWQADFEFLDKPAFGAPGLTQYLGWLRAWRDQAMENEANPVLDTAIEWLHSEQPQSDHVDVLWGDSNLGNYLFSKTGSVAAVLDFEAAALGPAEIDLGWWFFVDEMLTQGEDRLSGMPNRNEQLNIYTQALGRDVIALEYFEVMAALRMSLVIARTAQILKKAGRLSHTNQSAFENPALSLLARKLHLAEVNVGQQYMDFVKALSER